MSRFDIRYLPLVPGAVVSRKPIGDQRGFLERMFCDDELSELLGGEQIAQINRTLTKQAGTIRGMHFQHPPHCEVKLVSCLHGAIFDVIVDVRTDSPTFLHWHGERLDDQNSRTMVVPAGFAHGFQTLVDDCELMYLHTASYHPDAEDAINAMDTKLNITWPLPITEISARDRAHKPITSDYAGVRI